MSVNKLFLLLDGLSLEEMKKFGTFLMSPYHNTNSTIIRFYTYLKKDFPYFSDKCRDKKNIHNALFSDKEFTSRRVTDLLSDVSLLLEKFIAYEEIERDKVEQKMLFIRGLANRRIHPSFERETAKITKKLEAEIEKESLTFFRLYTLNAAMYFHPSFSVKINFKEYLKSADYNLDAFFTLEKLRYSYEMKQLSKTSVNVRYQKEAILNASFFEKESNSFQILPLLPRLLDDNEEGIFKKTYTLFKDNSKTIPKDFKEVILLALINYTGKKPIGKESDTIRFDLYTLRLEENLLVQNEQISTSSFYNISTTAIRLQKISWVQNFIENYTKYLNSDIKENLILLIQANICYTEGKFEECIDCINEINQSKFVLRRAAELLAIRACYEIYTQKNDYKDAIIYRIKALQKTYYRNDKINTSSKDSALNFLTFILQIIIAQDNPNFNQNKKEVLLKKIAETPLLSFRDYLFEKLNEIKV